MMASTKGAHAGEEMCGGKVRRVRQGLSQWTLVRNTAGVYSVVNLAGVWRSYPLPSWSLNNRPLHWRRQRPPPPSRRATDCHHVRFVSEWMTISRRCWVLFPKSFVLPHIWTNWWLQTKSLLIMTKVGSFTAGATNSSNTCCSSCSRCCR